MSTKMQRERAKRQRRTKVAPFVWVTMFMIVPFIISGWWVYKALNPKQTYAEGVDFEQFAYDNLERLESNHVKDGRLASYSEVDKSEIQATDGELRHQAVIMSEDTREIIMFDRRYCASIGYQVSYQERVSDPDEPGGYKMKTRYRDVSHTYEAAPFIALQDGLIMEAGLSALNGNVAEGADGSRWQVITVEYSTDTAVAWKFAIGFGAVSAVGTFLFFLLRAAGRAVISRR